MSVPDEFLIIEKPCSVTMFDMKVRFTRDGRERGIWIWLEDNSEGRRATYEKWLEGAIEVWKKMASAHKLKAVDKFAAWMSLDDAIRGLLRSSIEEAILIEWDDWEEIYKKLGEVMWQARAKRILEEEHGRGRKKTKSKAKKGKRK